jgi:hypothetical protein
VIKVSGLGKALKAAPHQTRAEALAMTAATGVAVGTTNAVINQHYIAKGKNKVATHRATRKGGAK